jgi:hypothetical protein
LLIRSALETEKNLQSASVAQALAIKVLPVPGGPYINIPFHAGVFSPNRNPNYLGRIRASFSIFLASSKPAISSHLTFGFSYIIVFFNAFFNYASSPSSLPFPDLDLLLLVFPPSTTVLFFISFLNFSLVS